MNLSHSSIISASRGDMVEVLMKDRELTGKPMKDFFDCTTSPSTILAVIYRALAKRIERHRIEGRAERCLDVVRRKDFTDDARKKSRCELKKIS